MTTGRARSGRWRYLVRTAMNVAGAGVGAAAAGTARVAAVARTSATGVSPAGGLETSPSAAATGAVTTGAFSTEAGTTSAALADAAVDRAIGDCAVYHSGRRSPGRVSLTRAVRTARRGEGFVWLGLRHPSPSVVAEVASRFDLPALAVEDAVQAHQRPKLDVYGDVVFVVLKPVRYVDHDEVVDVDELALFIGPTFVVSVRHGGSDVLQRVRAELDGGRVPTPWHGPASVLHRAADLVVDEYGSSLDRINEDVDQIETEVFGAPQGVDHTERIYKLKREIAEFRRAVLPLAPALERMASASVPAIPAPLAPYFNDVHDHLLRAVDAIEAHDRLLTDVLQANLAKVATLQNQIAIRQNEDMRRISAWAAIALVPTAIAGIYGMNFDHMPELRWEYGYFAVLSAIVVTCTVLHRLFHRNGWL